MFKLYMLAQYGRRHNIADVASFEEATQLVTELTKQHAEWVAEGKPVHPFYTIPANLETGDIYLQAEDGRTWMHTYFGWQTYQIFQKKQIG